MSQNWFHSYRSFRLGTVVIFVHLFKPHPFHWLLVPLFFTLQTSFIIKWKILVSRWYVPKDVHPSRKNLGSLRILVFFHKIENDKNRIYITLHFYVCWRYTCLPLWFETVPPKCSENHRTLWYIVWLQDQLLQVDFAAVEHRSEEIEYPILHTGGAKSGIFRCRNQSLYPGNSKQ